MEVSMQYGKDCFRMLQGVPLPRNAKLTQILSQGVDRLGDLARENRLHR